MTYADVLTLIEQEDARTEAAQWDVLAEDVQA